MQNPVRWHYLTAPIYNTPTWGPFSIAYVAIFGAGLVICLALYNDLFRQLRKNRLRYDAIRHCTAPLIAVFVIGLFFFLFRYLRVSVFYLSLRLWLYATFAAFIALLGYSVRYMRTEYPARVQAQRAQKLKQRYLSPSPSASSISRGQRSSKRRKKARTAYRSVKG